MTDETQTAGPSIATQIAPAIADVFGSPALQLTFHKRGPDGKRVLVPSETKTKPDGSPVQNAEEVSLDFDISPLTDRQLFVALGHGLQSAFGLWVAAQSRRAEKAPADKPYALPGGLASLDVETAFPYWVANVLGAERPVRVAREKTGAGPGRAKSLRTLIAESDFAVPAIARYLAAKMQKPEIAAAYEERWVLVDKNGKTRAKSAPKTIDTLLAAMAAINGSELSDETRQRIAEQVYAEVQALEASLAQQVPAEPSEPSAAPAPGSVEAALAA